MDEQINAFRLALETLNRARAEEIFRDALTGRSPIEAVELLVTPALTQIGESWQRGDLALSQVYMSGRCCEGLVDRYLPPSDPDRKHQPRSAIAVLCDNHDLGKRIVYSVMRAAGYEIFDYGHMEVDELVERALREKIRVLLISVLMLPSALKVGPVCAKLRASSANIKILVGGAPFVFDPWLWQEVGADAVGCNAAEAVGLVQKFMMQIDGGRP